MQSGQGPAYYVRVGAASQLGVGLASRSGWQLHIDQGEVPSQSGWYSHLGLSGSCISSRACEFHLNRGEICIISVKVQGLASVGSGAGFPSQVRIGVASQSWKLHLKKFGWELHLSRVGCSSRSGQDGNATSAVVTLASSTRVEAASRVRVGGSSISVRVGFSSR